MKKATLLVCFLCAAAPAYADDQALNASEIEALRAENNAIIARARAIVERERARSRAARERSIGVVRNLEGTATVVRAETGRSGMSFEW